jgi:hypothetical protein
LSVVLSLILGAAISFSTQRVVTWFDKSNDYFVYHEKYNGLLNFEYPQVWGLKDKAAEARANENLKELFYRVSFKNAYGHNYPIVEYQGKEYLSVCNIFISTSGNGWDSYFHIYQTISIKSGEKLFLNDFIDVNKEFVSFIMNSPEVIKRPNIMEGSPDSDEAFLKLMKKILNEDEVLERLLEACADYTEDNWYDKCGFYLLEGEIYITDTRTYSKQIGFKMALDDIKPYLKVPKW